MTDARIRRLERDSPADPSARARLLAERARAGLVSQVNLRLAAHCGLADACLVLGVAPPNLHPSSRAWFHALSPFGKHVGVRAAVVAGRVILPAWTRLGLSTAAMFLEAAEAWLACPCKDHRRTADAARAAAIATRAPRAAVNIATAAARRDRNATESGAAARLAAKDAAAAAWNLRDLGDQTPDAATAALVACGFRGVPTLGAIQGVVAGHLAAWALDHSTPLPSGAARTALPNGPTRL